MTGVQTCALPIFKFDKSIYVVASEQDYHFKVLFKLLKMLDFDFADQCYHLSYGMVYLPHGRMKSREGTIVDADNILDKMTELAKKEIKKRHKKLSEKELQKRAKVIGIGALRFFMLKLDAVKDMHFDPKESISFEGETGPYVQYAYARISSILKKYKKEISNKIDFSLLKEEKEHNLIKLLSRFQDVVKEAERTYRPHIIARYLLDLSQLFNEFYHKHQILKEEKGIKEARLLLIYCVKEILEKGLNLLKIDVLKEM